MQTETITQIEKFKLAFEKLNDWVYIKIGKKDPYLLPRKLFDKEEAKHAKDKVPYNWLLAFTWIDVYLAFSEDYLKQYFDTGYWSPQDYKTWTVGPLPLLRAGVKDRYYQGNVQSTGFLTFDEKFVRRPFPFELHGYRLKEELVKKLLKNPKIISAGIKEVPHYNREVWEESESIHVVYLPSVREFNKLVDEGKASASSAEWDIIKRLEIKKFKKENDY